jgi:hypothetical protein
VAGNLYDEALESLDDANGGTPTRASNPLYDEALSVLRDSDAAAETGLRRSLRSAADTTPDKAAESRRLALTFGVPAPVIERNFDEYTKRDALDHPYGAMQRQSPHTAAWLQEGNNAAIAKDDLASLGTLEWLVTAPQRAFAQGMNQVRGDQLRYQSMFRPLTQQEQDLLNSYRYQAKAEGALGADDSWFRRAVAGGVSQLPLLAGVTLMGAKYGVAGAATTATVGAAMGAPAGGVGAIPGAAAGWGVGLAAGTAYGTFRAMGQLAAGQAYERYLALRDEGGQPIDPDVAKAAALGTGVLNGLLGAVGVEKLIEKIPGLDKLTGAGLRSAVEVALKTPTVRAALAQAVKKYGVALGTQATIGVGMEAANVLGAEIAKTSSGQPFARATPGDVFTDLIHAGVGAMQDFALLSAVGPAFELARGIHDASVARHNTEYFAALGDEAAKSKVMQRAPEAVRDLIERATEQGPVKAVYAPVESWVTYWQSKGVDPAEMARQVTGERDALERAQETGTDLKIPTARYATTIAPTEHNAFFARELRLDPNEMNAREAEDFLKNAQTAPAAEQAAPTPREQVRQQILDKLLAAQVPRETAEHYAQLIESGVGTMAESAGVDPFELFQRYGVQVERPALAEGVGPQDAAGRSLGGFAGPERRSENTGAPEGTDERRQPADQVRLDLQNPEMRKAAAQLEARARDAHGARKSRPRAYTDAIAGPAKIDIEADAKQNPEGYINAGHETRSTSPAEEGARLPDGAPEQPHADQGGHREGEGDGRGAEPRRLPTWRLEDVGAGTDDAFQRRSLEENQARLTPEVRRELEHMLDELGVQPYEPRNWHWLERGEKKTGNAGGGDAIVTAGHAEGELYKDIRGFAPLNKNNKGELASKVHGSGNRVQAAVTELLKTGDVKNNLAEGALRVAENRAADDWTDLSPLLLPRPWAEGAPREFTDALSEAIDKAVNESVDETGLEDADTSFDVSEFGQGLFDALDEAILNPDDAAKADTLDTGEQQPRLPGDAGAVRDQNVATPEFEAPFSLTSEVARPGKGKQTTLFQPFYHGSPHDFERFSLERVGSGEGAAAYGWGLYFAENPAVAADYHDRLSQGRDVVHMKLGSLSFGERDGFNYGRRAHVSTIENIRASLAEDMLADALETNAAGVGGFQAAVLKRLDEKIADYALSGNYEEGVRAGKRLRAELEKPGAVSVEFTPTTGGVYQVDIPDEHIAKMLDWDKPLSEQPENVQQALADIAPDHYKPGADDYDANERGEMIYNRLARILEKEVTINSAVGSYSGFQASQEAASNVLKEHGVPGLRYLDQGSRDAGEGTRNVVVFDDSIVTLTHKDGTPFTPAERKEFFQGDSRNVSQQRRGSIEIGPDRQIKINLFERADLSTFVHETGHFFLEVFGDLVDQVKKLDAATLTDGQQRLVADYDAVLAELGVNARGDVTTEHHERFARMFEAYLFEGKAPSLELRSAFARFRAWLIGVYRELRNLNAPMTDEVRGVFDRMLASDRAIADAEAAGRLEPLFTDAAQAGMSPEEFSLYRAHVSDASRRAREELDAKLLSEVRRTQEADYRAKREAMQTTVRGELQQQPIYQALAGIRKGTQADGSPIVEGMETPPLKLSRQMIVERYGADRLSMLPKPYVYTRDGGLDPDLVASRYGFSSGDELLRAIASTPALTDAVEHETERRMLAQHGSLLLDGTLPDEAKAAAANDHRDAVIRAELRALWSLQRTVASFVKAGAETLRDAQRERDYERRWFEAEAKLRVAIAEGRKQADIDALEQQVSDLKAQARGGAATIQRGIPPASVLRDMARTRIASTRVIDLEPALFWSASRRAAQSAIDAAARQEFDGAISAKTSELVNLALFREAERAKADVDTRVSKIRDLAKAPARQRLGLAGESYLDQVDGVLDRYDFARASQKTLDRRTSIMQFVQSLEAQGLPVDLPDELLNEARRVHYSRLTVEELVGVSDGLAQIVHLSRLKNKLLKAAAGRELQATADALTLSIGDHATTQPNTAIEVRGPGTSTSRSIAQFFAAHRKVSSIIRQMDGFKDGGAVWEHIMRPLNEAADAEAVRNEQATIALHDIFHDAYAGEETSLYHKTFIPAINNSLSKMARLMVALNWGNEGNRDRIRLGYKWSDEQVNAILGTLDARDAKFVQAVWDHLESYWPDIEAKERRVTGVAPEKVPAAAVTIGGEQLRGGYFPIKYENQLSARAAANLEASFADGIKQAAYAKATTARGHTKQRVARVSEPVRLDFGVITDHVQQVIHDLTHHETLIDVGRLLAQRDVAAAVYAHYSDVVYDQLKGAVRDIAFGNQPAPGWYKTLNAIRAKTVTATLGWNAVVSLMHSLQITRGMVRVGPEWVAKGLVRWAVSARNAEHSVGWIEQQSDMMRLRWKTQQRELNEVRNTVGFDRGKVSAVVHDALSKVGVHPDAMPEIADTYFYAIRRIVQFAEIPTWIGAYEKAMADPANDHGRSVALADQAVIDSMGSGQIKDLAAVQRAPMSRLLTTFYDYHNSVYNQAYELVKSAESPGKKLVDATMLLLVPVALGAALHHAAAGQKERKREEKQGSVRTTAAEGLDYTLGMFVGLRELSGAFTGRGYEGPAGLGFIPTARKFLYRVSQGQPNAATAKAANEFAGELFGYPARQVERTAEGIQELWSGKTKDPTAIFFGPREAK